MIRKTKPPSAYGHQYENSSGGNKLNNITILQKNNVDTLLIKINYVNKNFTSHSIYQVYMSFL